MKKLITKTHARLLTALLLINSPCVLALDYDFGFKAGFESIKWEEFDKGDRSLLTETGLRFVSVGFVGNTSQLQKVSIFNVEIKSYIGVVGYDGETQDGVPVTTDTTYTGFNLKAEAGGRFGNTNGIYAWDVVSIVDFDSWTRYLASGTDAIGRQTGVAEEKYTIFNIRIGTGPAWKTENWNGRIIFGVKQPIYTNETLDSSYTGFTEDITLKPKGIYSAFFTFNNDIQLTDTLHLKIDAYYDSYRFNKSDPVDVVSTNPNGYSGPIWQPKSYQDTYGIVAGLGWKF